MTPRRPGGSASEEIALWMLSAGLEVSVTLLVLQRQRERMTQDLERHRLPSSSPRGLRTRTPLTCNVQSAH